MRMDFFQSKYETAGYVLIKIYSDFSKQTVPNIGLVTDDFVIRVDNPFSTMSLFDDGTILFGSDRVTALKNTVIDISDIDLSFEFLYRNQNAKYYRMALIKVNNQVFGEIHFYDEDAYNVLKDWLDGYSRISN